MESSLKISNAQDQANGPRVSNKIESSTTIFPCETEPLNSDNVESTSIASHESTYRKKYWPL